MKQAASKLVGDHDFRNFCKMNVENGVTNHVRRIITADINVLDEVNEDGYTMCELTVVGTAFLYHQIRCIVSILFYVGKGLEAPEVWDENFLSLLQSLKILSFILKVFSFNLKKKSQHIGEYNVVKKQSHINSVEIYHMEKTV